MNASTVHNLTWEALCRILAADVQVPSDESLIVAFSLPAMSALHFLDRQAIKLATRLGRRLYLLPEQESPSWQRVRIEACCLTTESARFAQVKRIVPYEPGAIVKWLAATTPVTRVGPLWRDYQTSLDHEYRVPASATIEGSWPHLRLGIITGVDLFNCGEYYAAHEDWESLWMRLDDGPERLTMQGLIQLCGAHIHRLKGRLGPCQTMWEKAGANLQAGRTLDWIDVDALCAASTAALAAPLDAPIVWPEIPLVNCHKDVPRKHR